jgi:glycosyltransferase involved in cell wall biosynthesis
MSHIAFFLPDLSGGGAERVLLTLAGQFIRQGHRLDLVLGRARGDFARQVPEGVRVVNLSSTINLPGVAGLALVSLFGLVHYLRRERPDAILSTLSRANILMVLAGKLAHAGSRVILREANTFHNHGWLTRAFMWLLYPVADGVVAVSAGIASDLEGLGRLDPGKLKVIYNPVNLSEIDRQAEQGLEHDWFRRGEPPVILAIGRLVRQKDFGMLLRAFALLREQRPVRLVILGEGAQAGELQRLAGSLGVADDFLLAGFVANPYRFIRRAAAVAVSSRWEGMINVLIEAIAVGTPVVSTDCHSGPAEILEQGRYGKLVPVGDSEAFARALAETLDHPLAADVLRGRANDFSVDGIWPKYLDFMLRKPGQERLQQG